MSEIRRIYRRWAFFLSIVWRPTWPPPEAGWWEAHWTYRLRVVNAWEVAGVGLEKPVEHRGRVPREGI